MACFRWYPQVAQNSFKMTVFFLKGTFLYLKKIASIYSLFDRGLILNPLFRSSYPVTHIMSQRSLFNHASGNIFYEAIRFIIYG